MRDGTKRLYVSIEYMYTFRAIYDEHGNFIKYVQDLIYMYKKYILF